MAGRKRRSRARRKAAKGSSRRRRSKARLRARMATAARALGPAMPVATAGGDAGAASDYARAIAEHDAKIAELTAQVNAAAASAEAAEKLSKEIAEVRAQAESDRVEYQLTLAGAKNVKAARALLEDHGGDVEKLKAAEPWLFGQAGGATGTSAGSTGLPNAGAAKDSERQLKHFYEVAGAPTTRNSSACRPLGRRAHTT